jgi:hypothetical protein
MTYFSIEKCGLYKHGSEKVHGLGISETFAAIAEWVKDLPLKETMPWNPKEVKAGLSKCYCKDIHHDPATGDYLLVLWKSDSDDKGHMWGAYEDDLPSSGTELVEFDNRHKGRNVIWGRPCYYWFIPEHETVVSIKFEHSLCDSELMKTWVTSAICNVVSHPNKKTDTTEKGFKRFSFTDGSYEANERYRFALDASMKTMNTSGREMSDLASKVTHIVQRDVISLTAPDERQKWLKWFDRIPHLDGKPRSQSRKIEIRAEAKPTAQQVKEIIERFGRENRKSSDWENVGFQTGDEKTIVWADSYRLKNDILFAEDIKGTIPARKLFAKLNINRYAFTKSLNAESKKVRTAGS